jgi:hypothetical protein
MGCRRWDAVGPLRRGLHPSSFRLNVGTVYGIRWVISLTKTGEVEPNGEGLHSFTFRLNVSNLCGIRWVILLTNTGQVEPKSGRVLVLARAVEAAASGGVGLDLHVDAIQHFFRAQHRCGPVRVLRSVP